MVKISFNSADSAPAPAPQGPDLRMTDAAATRLTAILAKHSAAYLRITVKGGGCNGYSYKFDLAEESNSDDQHVVNETHPNTTVLIDPASFKLLKGAVLDFEDTLEASQFIIKNPNAKSSCGCGNSFGL